MEQVGRERDPEAPQPRLTVLSVAAGINNEISRLHEAIHGLEENLSPALGGEEPSNVTKAGGDVYIDSSLVVDSSLVDTMDGLLRGVREARKRVEQITRRSRI